MGSGVVHYEGAMPLLAYCESYVGFDSSVTKSWPDVTCKKCVKKRDSRKTRGGRP